MIKSFINILFRKRSPETPKPETAWREPPTKTIRENVGFGVVAEISYPIGHHGFMNVVGEQSYQDALRCLPEVFTAQLVPEGDNPHDRNAVSVRTLEGQTVGYLAREVARIYQPKLIQHGDPVTCPAKLTGGEGSKTSFGVVLDFEDVRKALGLPLMAVDRAPLDYEAVAEYHRVNHAARELVKATRSLERTDLTTAEAQYRRALTMIRECHKLATSRDLLAHGFIPNQTDTVALERLVVCLMRLGRIPDAISEINNYCDTFPHAREMKLITAIQARLEKARTGRR